MLSLLLTVALMMSPDIEPPPKYKIRIEKHEIWLDTTAGPRRVIYDAAASYPVAVSGSGDKVAYAVPDGKPAPDGAKPSMMIAVVTAGGRAVSKFAPPDPYFDSLEWIDDYRPSITLGGHANSIYWVLDSNTGKTLKEFWGGFDFLWSHDRQHIARRALGPITSEDENEVPFQSDDLSSLMFNDEGKGVYPPEDPKTEKPYERILGDLTWSPDDEWVSFPERENPSGDSYVVLASPEGGVLRDSLPVDVEHNAKIAWTDDSHFQINASKRTLYFAIRDGKLGEVPSPALH